MNCNRFILLIFFVIACPVGATDALQVALDYLHAQQRPYSLSNQDFDDLIVKTNYRSLNNGIHHLVLRQQHGGIELFNGDAQINVSEQGTVLNAHINWLPSLAKAVNTISPEISAEQALRIVAQHLRLTPTEAFTVLSSRQSLDQYQVFNAAGISLADIPVHLLYQTEQQQARLTWAVSIQTPDHQHWWQLRVDTVTGKIIGKNDWVSGNGNYFVFPLPMVSPEDKLAYQKMMTNPINGNGTVIETMEQGTPLARRVQNVLLPSPFAWHDTDGVFGAEYQDTRGNNVFAQADPTGKEDPLIRAEGGMNLLFDAPFAPTLPADQGHNHQAATGNVFYWGNMLHDILYRYGFDEAAGNFQLNNYMRGGANNDPVLADVHDGALSNHATFATPPDGQSPRMQLGLWNTTWPPKDSAFDNMLIIHEYAHGVISRLTGGAANSHCLTEGEGLAEGWADWLALALTTKKDDLGATPRGFGRYLLNQPMEGRGMRIAPYSTDMAKNAYTYSHLAQLENPYDSGFLWATVLWDMYWALITEYGFEPHWQLEYNWKNRQAGNQRALQGVIDGLKLQPCQPSFTAARDAILLADVVDNQSKNQCLLWTVFARRGLGYSANAHNPHDLFDGAEAFDLPPVCRKELLLTPESDSPVVQSGDDLRYQVHIKNNTTQLQENVQISETLAKDTTYIQGSSNCSVSEKDGVLTFMLGDMAVGAEKTCEFKVSIAEGIGGTLYFSDPVNAVTAWAADKTVYDANHWTYDAAVNTWSIDDKAGAAERALVMQQPVVLGENAYLTFLHDFDTENGFDGGVVELSRDGGLYWQDVGDLITENGYNQTISTGYGSAIAGQRSFSGLQIKPLASRLDLSRFAGETVLLRFNMATDASISQAHWRLRRINLVSNAPAAWHIDHGAGDVSWSLAAHEGRSAWFASNMATASDQYLTLNQAVRLLKKPAPTLRFWHHIDSEAGFDGGVVELSNDGGQTWQDIGHKATKNGYNRRISSRHNSALAGRVAFSGYNAGFQETVIDLSAFAGQQVKIRFRFASDNSEAGNGWFVDDIELSSEASVVSQVCSSSKDNSSVCEQQAVRVLSAQGLQAQIALNPVSLSEGLTQGDASRNQVLTVKNTGSADLHWQWSNNSGYGQSADNGLLNYGFETKPFLASGWSRIGQNPRETWYQSNQAYTGRFSARINGDNASQEEWLLSPELDLTKSATLAFWSKGSFQVWLIVDDIGGNDDVFIGNSAGGQSWQQTVFELSKNFSGNAHVGFRYHQATGTAYLDNVWVDNTAKAGVCQSIHHTSWLDSNDYSGVIAPETSAKLNLRFSAPVTTSPQKYAVNLCIASNDPQTPVALLPVTFTLQKSPSDQSTSTTTPTNNSGNTNTVNPDVSVSGGL